MMHRTAVLVSVILTAAGCAVGPNYKRPTVDSAPAFKEQGDWKPSAPADALERGNWWQIFQDPVLDDLERQIDISNQNLKQAEDNYRQARAVVDESRASFWPTLAGSASQTRQQVGPARANTVTTVGGQASWNIDLWGQIRREVESSKASAQASEAAVGNARLSAQSTLATDYFELRAQDSLKALLDDTVADEQRSLAITESRYKFGVAAKADVVTAQTQLLASQAQQINAGIQRAQLEHAIALLVGKVPAEFSLPAAPLREDVPTVPTGVPSALLERRPDVAQAERNVAVANAQIGVAEAAYFPSLTLSGSVTYTGGSALHDLLTVPNRVWGVGPSLAANLFQGGLTHAQVAAARAAYDASVDAYRQTVLTSFQQVEDNLVALRLLEQQAQIEDETVKAAKEAERLTLNQYKAGTVPYTSVITAQTTTVSSEQNALTVLMDRLSASISLIEALGGGWSTAQLN